MAVWWKRYEPILEAKPISGHDAVVDLMAKELVEMLEQFPPAEADVEWEDPALEKRLRGHLAELPKLDADLVDVIGRAVILDLEHIPEGVDSVLREAATRSHYQAAELVWRAILEHLYARKEEAPFLKRKDLVAVVDKMRSRFRERRHNES